MSSSVVEYLDEQQLATELGIPRRTPDQWRYLNRGPRYVKVGRHVRYDRRDVTAWLEANKHGGPDAP